MVSASSWGLFVSVDYGSTFSNANVLNSPSNTWSDAAISGDGKYTYASVLDSTTSTTALYFSANYLISFSTTYSPLTTIANIAFSTDGSTVYVTDHHQIYCKTNSTWVLIELLSDDPNFPYYFPHYFDSIATNGNGSSFAALAADNLFISTAYGVGWVMNPWNYDCWVLRDVSMSLSGALVYVTTAGAMCNSNSSAEDIVLSNAPPAVYSSVAMDATGSTVVGVSQQGVIYLTRNSGTSWSPNYYDFVDVVMSKDGQLL